VKVAGRVADASLLGRSQRNLHGRLRPIQGWPARGGSTREADVQAGIASIKYAQTALRQLGKVPRRRVQWVGQDGRSLV
jgi:hypothetical protein